MLKIKLPTMQQFAAFLNTSNLTLGLKVSTLFVAVLAFYLMGVGEENPGACPGR
jgi:hypothetical protein